jgi:hypothetical protein
MFGSNVPPACLTGFRTGSVRTVDGSVTVVPRWGAGAGKTETGSDFDATSCLLGGRFWMAAGVSGVGAKASLTVMATDALASHTTRLLTPVGVGGLADKFKPVATSADDLAVMVNVVSASVPAGIPEITPVELFSVSPVGKAGETWYVG